MKNSHICENCGFEKEFKDPHKNKIKVLKTESKTVKSMFNKGEITYIKHYTNLDKGFYFCHTIDNECGVCNEKEKSSKKTK